MKPQTQPARLLVVASTPRLCPLCDDDGAVRLVRVDRVRGAGRVRCPHCVDHMPVLHLPFRIDHPRDVA